MRLRTRRVRYGLPIAVVIIGLIVAAVDTHSVGNTIATVFIAAGLIWFMVAVGRDIGMGERDGARRHVPAPPPGPGGSDQDSPS